MKLLFSYTKTKVLENIGFPKDFQKININSGNKSCNGSQKNKTEIKGNIRVVKCAYQLAAVISVSEMYRLLKKKIIIIIDVPNSC